MRISAARWTPEPWPWRPCITTPARSSPATCPRPSSIITPTAGKLRGLYADLLTPADPQVEELVKAADKLSAHIKCLEEEKAGNHEFCAAARQTRQALEDMHLPEVDLFLEEFLPSFRLTLDELE